MSYILYKHSSLFITMFIPPVLSVIGAQELPEFSCTDMPQVRDSTVSFQQIYDPIQRDTLSTLWIDTDRAEFAAHRDIQTLDLPSAIIIWCAYDEIF
mmetsp:Transcript_54354/g.90349  ORF Transcript_54354/g.90349 Transcript_54354/m.90349 type:complete len:97 (+) Transcript_54354:332-622(+)